MKRGAFIILFLTLLLVSGCASRFVTKECLYKEGDIWKSMGIFCEKIQNCIDIKEISRYESVETENIMCSSTSLKKIVNGNGAFVNCNAADDCYRVLEIEKPFDEFNVVACDDEFCKTTSNYYDELAKGIKKEESTVIPLEPVEDNITTEEETPEEELVIVPTGCGDNICDMDENCVNCEGDCGCTPSVAYCNTTKSICMPLPEE